MRLSPLLFLVIGCWSPVNDVPVGKLPGPPSMTAGGEPAAGGGTQAQAGGSVSGGGATAGGVVGGGSAGGMVGGGAVMSGCLPGSWCWEHPRPAGYGLNAVFVESATTAWAVGQRGSILRLDGTMWTAVARVTDHDLETLTGSPTNLFAVGRRRGFSSSMSSSRVLRFDGTRWALVPHGSLPLVTTASAAGDGEAWLLTSANSTLVAPELLRWNGSAFVPTTGPQGVTPVQLCVRSASEVWLTAATTSGSFPSSLHRWNGSSWALVHQFAGRERFEGPLGCPAEGLAVSRAYEFDTGTSLSVEARSGAVRVFPADWSRMFVTPHNDVFVERTLGVDRWVPGGWQPTFTIAQTPRPTNLDFLVTNGLLANGTSVLSTWTGQTFTALRAQVGTFKAALTPTGQDPLAVFGDGSYATRTGSSWTVRATPMVGQFRFRVEAVWPTPTGAWLVGNAIARFDVQTGAVTPVVSLPNAAYAQFSAIDGVDELSLWAVGQQTDVRGLLVRRFDGQAWVAPAVPVPTRVDGLLLDEAHFTGVDVRSANDVMLLGTDPAGGRFVSVFYRWNGSTWTTALTAGTTVSLFDRDPQGAVYVVEADEVKKATALDDRSTWQSLGTLPGAAVKLRVFGVNQLEVVVRRDDGTTGLYTWDAARSAFVLARPEVDAAVNDLVWGAGQDGQRRLWALGGEGALLQLTPQ